jgi:hypothetical protein
MQWPIRPRRRCGALNQMPASYDRRGISEDLGKRKHVAIPSPDLYDLLRAGDHCLGLLLGCGAYR